MLQCPWIFCLLASPILFRAGTWMQHWSLPRDLQWLELQQVQQAPLGWEEANPSQARYLQGIETQVYFVIVLSTQCFLSQRPQQLGWAFSTCLISTMIPQPVPLNNSQERNSPGMELETLEQSRFPNYHVKRNSAQSGGICRNKRVYLIFNLSAPSPQALPHC